jgi:hypothetical protein
MMFQTLESKDNNARYEAFKELFQLTEQEVDWIYDYWQILVDKLSSENSFHRSIGLLLLANLTRSDSEDRFSEIVGRYLTFLDDEKFITARQCLQNVWRIAVNKKAHRFAIEGALKSTYSGSIHLERNPNLIKQDVIFSLAKIAEFYKDESLNNEIESMILKETDKKTIKGIKGILATV